MKKLWEKNYKQNAHAEAYCFGETAALDTELVFYDAIGSIAHAQMLVSIGILTQQEYGQLKACLLQIIAQCQRGKFTIGPGDEDVHTKIENYLTKKLGNVGKKIHTGRSRNDQVLVDLRLWSKDQMLHLALSALDLAEAFLDFAEKYEYIPMPGYTHMQKAMPSSVGLWAGSFAESLLDDLELVQAAYTLNNQSPLGSAASYGVSLPIDRFMTANVLGFTTVQNNSLYCQMSRGKIHAAMLHAVTQLMLTMSRFAQDVLLFTTGEFSFFAVSDELTTGSSIMPQKKNLDILEIVRARTQTIIGYEHIVSSIISSLPSGYNADVGETKYPLMKSMEIVGQTVPVIRQVVAALIPNTGTLETACTPELFATHAAYLLVKDGMPFREAYQRVGHSLASLAQFDPVSVLKESNHIGGPGNLALEKQKQQVKKKTAWWKKQHYLFTNTIEKLKGRLINITANQRR